MPTGTVKCFNTTKGYAFIRPDDGGNDVFVHVTAVEQAGLEGQRLNFESETGQRGLKAVALAAAN